MFEKLFVGKSHLNRKIKNAKKRFSIKTPKTTDFTPDEEKKYFKMFKPVYNKMMKIYNGDMKHPQISSIINNLKKNGYDLKKSDSVYYKKLTEGYEFLSKLYKNNKEKYQDTTVQVFLKAYEMMNDPKLRAMIIKAEREYKAKIKNSKINDKTSNFAELGAIFIALYIIMVIALILYLVIIIIALITEIDTFTFAHARKEKSENLDIEAIEKKHASFIVNVMYPLVDIIEFFDNVDLNKMIKLSNSEFKKVNDTQDYKQRGNESIIFINKEEQEKLSYYYGVEDMGIGLVVVIVAGVGLFLMILFPAIRNMIYWYESTKVDMRDFYIEEAELLENNVAKLQEQLNNSNNDIEKKKLQAIIDKQIAYREKMLQKADKWYIEEKNVETIAESQYNEDERVFTEEDRASEEPTIYI